MKAVTQLNPDNTYTAHIEDHEGDGPVGRGETPLEALLDLAERLATTLEAEAVLEAIRGSKQEGEMTMTKYSGGPAFPSDGYNFGMSLRDWLAGQALANRYTEHESDPNKVAAYAYNIADAMLAARHK